MSTLVADPGFGRGQVLGVLWKAYDADNGDGSHVIGARKVFKDEDPSTGRLLSNRTVECIAVKNASNAALTPRQIVKFKSSVTAGQFGGGILGEVDGGAVAASTLVGVVDEYLPAAGVPVGEIFWLVVRGPSTATKTTGTGVTAGDSFATTATAGAGASGTTNTQVGFAIEGAGASDTRVRILVRTQAGF